jgi:hypothetical protein
MKKLLLLSVFSILTIGFISCEAPEIDNDEPKAEINKPTTLQSACPAPDTNCNGTPDHEETDPNLGG